MSPIVRLSKAVFVPSLAMALCATTSAVDAAQQCRVIDARGDEQCSAGIPSAQMAAVYASQRMDQWCWAASISMVFSFYGHPVAQERIVQEMFGGVVDLPAMSGRTITSALNRDWVDDDGVPFRASAEVSDLSSYQGAVDNDVIARELREGHPLIVGTRGHAMVVGGMDFVVSPAGTVVGVQSVTVRDPWPGMGRRQLRPDEMRPTYVAAIRVTDVAHDAATDDDDDSPPPRREPRRRAPAPPAAMPAPQMARACAMPTGAWCPMSAPVAVGSSCYCMSPYGPMPGVAR